MRPRVPVLERFMRMVEPEPTSGCWLWTGSGQKYGKITVGYTADGTKRDESAHRLSWQLFRGEVPPGLLVLHSCDVCFCVNPEHLFLGTNKENSADMASKWRGVKSKRGLPFGVVALETGLPYRAQVKYNMRSIFIGRFSTPEEASSAAIAKKRELYGSKD